MYNLSMHAHQALGFSLVFVSISETDDDLHTEVVATSHAQSDRLVAGEDYDSLQTFLMQTIDGLSRALSVGEVALVSSLESVDQSTVGGGAPGQQGQTERSEDDHA